MFKALLRWEWARLTQPKGLAMLAMWSTLFTLFYSISITDTVMIVFIIYSLFLYDDFQPGQNSFLASRPLQRHWVIAARTLTALLAVLLVWLSAFPLAFLAQTFARMSWGEVRLGVLNRIFQLSPSLTWEFFRNSAPYFLGSFLGFSCRALELEYKSSLKGALLALLPTGLCAALLLSSDARAHSLALNDGFTLALALANLGVGMLFARYSLPREQPSRYLGVLIALPLGLVVYRMMGMGGSVPPNFSSDSAWAAYGAGYRLTAPEARALEDKVTADSEDRNSRAALLGYYEILSMRTGEGSSAEKSFDKHYLWLVEHEPGSDLFRGLFLVGHGSETMVSASKAWESAIFKYAKNPVVLGNAARFYRFHREDRALDLLPVASMLDPVNPDWDQEMAEIYHGQKTKDAYSKAQIYFERALTKAKDPDVRKNVLKQACFNAWKAGSPRRAQALASELLRLLATPHFFYRDDGNATYTANTVLGLVALGEKKPELAAEYLVKAGRSSGSPVLGSYGPDFILANEVLKTGQRDRVVQFLKLCKNFWKRAELDFWINEIEAGRNPVLHSSYAHYVSTRDSDPEDKELEAYSNAAGPEKTLVVRDQSLSNGNLGSAIFASNGTGSDIELTLQFDLLENATDSKPLPFKKVIPAGKEVYLLSVKQKVKGKPWRFRYTYEN